MYAIIHPISPFDPSEGTDIYFTWNGNQIHQVRCLIKENESGQTVYDRTEASMKSYYMLPADSGLEGGGRYVVYITVFDADGQESQIQHTGTPFCCFTAPSFQLSIQEGDVIRASSFLVSADYSQEEGELLNSFEFFLYSYQGALIQSSGTIYDAENISYLISGLEDGKQYFIQAAGTTVNGFPLDTGRVSFSVAYIRKQIFSTIEANNLPEIGGIELRSNIVSTEGQPQKDVVYIDGACAGSRSAVSHAPSAFAYEKLTLENAVFDELYATAQPIGDFDGTIPENWTFDTYLHASFSGNLYGGNVNFTEDLVEAIRIKRRTKKDAQFQTIYEKPIYENEDFAIELLDYLEPAGPVEYAYVPVISGGESNYIITSVTSAFEGYFLCEKDRSFLLFLDASYSQTLNYDPVSVKPLGRKYPVMVINGDAGYLSGEMECLFLPFSEEDADLDRR